ncbi:MAG: zinc-ribbon domain-containing protein [Deltaproteobacteria bacterium]|nr:zinc-ribbon domain-containing protein [Deltaproteobacteria bacterium]
MEVGCKQCGAKYQFDSSAIPAAGYDAQCTSCGGVFFVAPAAAAAPPVSVACVHCGAVYQFEASAIPAEGYDAQCTQCNKVFFVSAGGGAPQPPIVAVTAPASAPVAAAPTIPAPAVLNTEPVVLAAKKPSAEVPVVATPKATPNMAPQGARANAAEVAGLEDGAEDAADMIQLSQELGDPAPDPSAASTEEDFEKIMARRRTRRIAVVAVLGAVVGYVAVTYFLVPRVFDLTLGRLLGIKLTINPEAVAPMERGLAHMLADTDGGYVEAIKDLEQALTIDPKYPDAVALAALAHVFRGADLQAQGKESYESGAKATAELKALEALSAKDKPADAAKRVEVLRTQGGKAAAESTRLFEAGGAEMSAALELLRPALAAYKDSPLIHAAAGIYYATDPDSVGRAAEMLRMAIELRSGANTALDLGHPPDVWTPLLQGLVKAAGKGGEDEARAAFAAAVTKEPRLLRARYELLQLFDRQGKTEDVKKVAAEILTQMPGHTKTKNYLERRPAAPAVAVAPPAPQDKPPAEPAPAKGKKAKNKRKR